MIRIWCVKFTFCWIVSFYDRLASNEIRSLRLLLNMKSKISLSFSSLILRIWRIGYANGKIILKIGLNSDSRKKVLLWVKCRDWCINHKGPDLILVWKFSKVLNEITPNEQTYWTQVMLSLSSSRFPNNNLYKKLVRMKMNRQN